MFLERPLGTKSRQQGQGKLGSKKFTGVFLKNVNLMKHFSTLFKCDVGKLHSKF